MYVYILRGKPQTEKLLLLNGNIVIVYGIPNVVVSSIAEAGLGALFVNRKEIIAICLIHAPSGGPPKATNSCTL